VPFRSARRRCRSVNQDYLVEGKARLHKMLQQHAQTHVQVDPRRSDKRACSRNRRDLIFLQHDGSAFGPEDDLRANTGLLIAEREYMIIHRGKRLLSKLRISQCAFT